MADKISTLILTVDLECGRCYKKIRKVIAKFPDIDWIFLLRTREIQSQIFDEKNNKVVISGRFDPEKLKRKLCCKACKYIKDIQIKPPDKPKPKQDPSPPPPKKDPPPPKQDPSPPPPKDPPPPSPKQDPPPPPPKKDPPPPSPKQDPPPPQPKQDPPPPKPAPMVCCRPCYEGYPEHGICTRFGYEPGTCNYKFFSEEDPSCSIM